MSQFDQISSIRTSDYLYDLPEDKIAKFALDIRDEAKLLVWDHGIIKHETFKSLPYLLPKNSTLFLNNTRVIPARIFFQKSTGAKIEIFLLEPSLPTNEIASAMEVQHECTWICMVGNLKKWRDSVSLKRAIIIDGQNCEIVAEITDRHYVKIRFSWSGDIPFVDIVRAMGQVPLPPYFNREANEADVERYQTVYSEKDGAVAAPTAGLHFTDELLANLRKYEVATEYLTLHVSAGTFKPLKESLASNHDMHEEQVLVTKANVEAALNSPTVIAVGTTSVRTLESLYWFGTKLVNKVNPRFVIEKLDPYKNWPILPTKNDALTAIIKFMEDSDLDEISGATSIFIMPGYEYKICCGMLTNFHLPGSTLILLIASVLGDNWRDVYEEALQNSYRFLSYGDSSLLLFN